MIDFNNLNLLTGAFISGELQKQGLTPEQAAKVYIQQSRNPQAGAEFDMSVIDNDPALRTPADLLDLEDLTQQERQNRRGASVVGEEGYQDKSYDTRRADRQGSAIRLPNQRPANYAQLLQEQVDSGDITPGERDRQSRIFDFLVKQGLVIDEDPLGQKALMQDMGLEMARVRMTPAEMTARPRTPVVFRQSGVSSIPEPGGQSYAIQVSGDTEPPVIGPTGDPKYVEVPKGRYVKARGGETPDGYTTGKGTKTEFITSRPTGGGGDGAARAESMRRLRIGLGIEQPSTARDVGIAIAPENRDAALRLLGDLELQDSPQEQLKAQQALARDAVRSDVASGAISREAETRSSRLDSEVRRDDTREEVGGSRQYQVTPSGEIGFRTQAPQETAIIETSGIPVDSGTRDPIMSDSIDRLGQMLAPDSVREVPVGSAAEFIIGNYQNDFATAAESSFAPFSVSDSLDGLTSVFENKGVSLGRPIRTAADLEEISGLFVEKSNAGRKGSDRFWSFDPSSSVQRLNSNPGVTEVLDKLRVRGGARTTIARALYEQELGMAAGIQPKDVNAIRARAGSALPNIYLGATARAGNTATESPAVGPQRMVNAASPGSQKIDGDNVSDALKKISVESNRRSQLQAALQAEEEFQGTQLTGQQRREAIGGLLESFQADDDAGIGRGVQNDARMPLIGAVAGESNGGNRTLSGLYIPPEGRTQFKSGKPRQSEEQQAKGRSLLDAITNARAERRMLDQVEGARSVDTTPAQPSLVNERAVSMNKGNPVVSYSDGSDEPARMTKLGNQTRSTKGNRSVIPDLTVGPVVSGSQGVPRTASERRPRVGPNQVPDPWAEPPGRGMGAPVPASFNRGGVSQNLRLDRATPANDIVSREGRARRRRSSMINTTQDQTPASAPVQAPKAPSFRDKIDRAMNNTDKEYNFRRNRRIGGYGALATGGVAGIGALISGERNRREEEQR